MSWLYLLLAGIAEVGWPLGFKLADLAPKGAIGNILWILFAVFCMAISGVLLFLAQREIPIGTAYLIWTGIGGLGTFVLGIWMFGEPTSALRYFGALLVLSGLGVLKFS